MHSDCFDYSALLFAHRASSCSFFLSFSASMTSDVEENDLMRLGIDPEQVNMSMECIGCGCGRVCAYLDEIVDFIHRFISLCIPMSASILANFYSFRCRRSYGKQSTTN